MKHLHDWSFDANGVPIEDRPPMARRGWRARLRNAWRRICRWAGTPRPL